MHIKVTRPTTFKLGDHVVLVKPHQPIQLPTALAKRLLAKVPAIRKARVKG